MNSVKTLSPERIAEIKAFKNTDFSDCPILTEEELKQFRPKHPENFKSKEVVQLPIDADVLAWFKGLGPGYERRINEVLRDAMLRSSHG
jgi:uncharacterized protein (DUF4415 family)